MTSSPHASAADRAADRSSGRPAPRSPLLAGLRWIRQRHPLREKLLVSPEGHPPQAAYTLLDRLAREGTGWIGFRATSVRLVAAALARPRLEREGRRPLPEALRRLMVEELADERLFGPGGRSYFAELEPGVGIYRALDASLRTLRLAGVRPEGLEPEGFVDPRKGRDLRELLAAYEERLRRGGWADGATLLRAALEGIEGATGDAPRIVVVPDEARLTSLEARLLRVLPASARYRIGWAGGRGVEPGPDRAERRLGDLPRVPPGEGPARPHRGAWLFRTREMPAEPPGCLVPRLALGSENEVRLLLREAVADARPLDEIEVLYTGGEEYPSLLLSETERLGVECTFADGVPVKLTRPGQAFRSLCDWILEDFDDLPLRRMFRAGLVDFRGLAPEPELLPAEAAALLREARIGRGRDRYGPALRRLESRAKRLAEERDEEGLPTDALESRLRSLRELRRVLDALFGFAPEGGEVLVADVARRGAEFLERLVPERGRLEPPAREGMLEALGQIAEGADRRMERERAVRHLRELLSEHRVSRSGPLPGRLHAASIRSGGYSGRALVTVVGLDETRFPGEGLEDPVLLDRERARVVPSSARARAEPAARLYDLARALGEAGGEVRASSAVREIVDDRELYPSSPFLQVFRVARGEPDASFETCLDVLSPPADFVPGGEGLASPAEGWLRAAVEGRPGYLAAVRERHPHLARGALAAEHRASADFTVHDGVTGAREVLDPRRSGEVVSPSRLEALIASPYRYFLRYVLGAEAIEEPAREAGRWLTPRERGSLLHEVFRNFMERVTAREERPEMARHSGLLEEVVASALVRWRELVPPPTRASARREAREIRTAARIFLRDEEDRADEAEPWAFEVRFGQGGSGRGGRERAGARSLALEEPVEVELGGGRLRFRGAIDRVDRLGEGRYRIWDYKTGSTTGYRRSRPFEGGHVQWLVYALAFERLLRRSGRDGRVVRSGYLFPGPRGHGERFEHRVDDRRVRELDDLLARHLDLVAEGLFPHATEAAACAYCDYRRACLDPDRRAEDARRKVEAIAGEGAGGPAGSTAARTLGRWGGG